MGFGRPDTSQTNSRLEVAVLSILLEFMFEKVTTAPSGFWMKMSERTLLVLESFDPVMAVHV